MLEIVTSRHEPIERKIIRIFTEIIKRKLELTIKSTHILSTNFYYRES